MFGMLAIVIAGALLVASQPVMAAPQQGKATVTSVKGAAEYSSGGAWAALKAGTVLTGGSIIKTGAGAQVKLNMGVNGEGVVVTENSTVGIDKLTFEQTGADTVAETQLDLKAGRILGNIKKSSPASRFEIKTPTGVAGIRGTKFDIGANGVVKVKSGCVICIYVDPSGQVTSHEVCGGFKFVPGVGVVPMTNDEMNDPAWNNIADTPIGSVRAAVTDGGGIIFVAPTLPISPTEELDRPAR
jgi:hypothetical protein